MKIIWEKFEENLKAKAHNPDQYLKVMSSLSKGLDEQQIKAFEKELGMKLPSDYKESLMVYEGDNTGYGEVFSYWILLCRTDVLHEASFGNDWVDDGDYTEYKKGYKPTPEELDNSVNFWSKHWIPIASNGGGDCICIDTAHGNEIIVHYHDDEGVPVIASSFTEFLQKEMKEFLENFNKPIEEKKEKKKDWIDKIFDLLVKRRG